MDDELLAILARAQSDSLNGIIVYFSLNGELLVESDKLGHHRFNEVLPLDEIVHSDVRKHEYSRLALTWVIVLQQLAWKHYLLLFIQLGSQSDLFVQGKGIVWLWLHNDNDYFFVILQIL